MFIVAGTSGTVRLSTNGGVSYSSQISGNGSFLKGLAWSQSLRLFVLVGNGGFLATSTDGVTWTSRTSQFGASNIEGIEWAPSLGLFVTVGGSGKLATSSDGINWTLRASGTGNLLYTIFWSASSSLFMTTGSSGIVRTSPDGVNWTTKTTIAGSGYSLLGISYAPSLGLWVAVGTLSIVYTSPDAGVTWTARTSQFGGTDNIFAITWSPSLSLFVIVGANGKLATSPDGINWTLRTSQFDTTLINIVMWSSVYSKFFTGSTSSPDGINWTLLTSKTPSADAITEGGVGSDISLALPITGVEKKNSVNYSDLTLDINAAGAAVRAGPGVVYAVPGVATASPGGPVDVLFNGIFARPGVATAGVGIATVTVGSQYTVPVYTVSDYRARFLSPQVNVTRRIEILEADGSTLWDDKFSNKKRLISGAVSVDYARDERRSCDLELANFDGALIHKPNGFWYDKVLRIFRGIEFYDTSGLRSYEVTLGTFMIDRVVQARFPKTVKITARDFTKKCMLSKFVQATGFTAGTPIETVIGAIASNAGIQDRVLPVTGKVLGVDTFFERGTPRWEAMKKIAEAFSYELFFNAQAYLIMRLFVDPTSEADSYDFETGPVTGNLVDWEKSTNDTRIFNHISIAGSDPDILPVQAEALNNNPNSPTRIEVLGDRVFPYESAFITTTQQAQDLANAYLKIYGLEEYEINLSAVPAPWLEAGEVICFVDPAAAVNDPDRFLLTSFTIPLDLSPMSAVGRRVTIVS